MKKIEVVIDKTGKVTVTTLGYKGAECLEASKAIEELLGEMKETKHTTEMCEIEQGVELVSQK